MKLNSEHLVGDWFSGPSNFLRTPAEADWGLIHRAAERMSSLILSRSEGIGKRAGVLRSSFLLSRVPYRPGGRLWFEPEPPVKIGPVLLRKEEVA